VTTLAYLYNEEGDTPRAGEVPAFQATGGSFGQTLLRVGYTYEQQKQYKNFDNCLQEGD